jgi:hypothetical protein
LQDTLDKYSVNSSHKLHTYFSTKHNRFFSLNEGKDITAARQLRRGWACVDLQENQILSAVNCTRLLCTQFHISSVGSNLVCAVSLGQGFSKNTNGALHLRNQIESSIFISPPNEPDSAESWSIEEAEL